MQAAPHVEQPLFGLQGVSVAFGGVQALADVTMSVRPGAVHGVIGPNGAGKTTLFNVACGFVSADAGSLVWKGTSVDRISPHRLAGHGIARTLQGVGLFDRMSVLENVMVGADAHGAAGFFATLLGVGRSPRDERALAERAHRALAELGVDRYAATYPGSLPYPIRKRVALARALVLEPELLLLDEPASGLSAQEMDELGELIRDLAGRTAVLLVEHHMDLVMAVCDQITAIDFGRVIADGTPDQIRSDPAVQAAYLGEDVEHREQTGAEGEDR